MEAKEKEELAIKIVNHAFKGKKDLSGEDYIYHLYRVRNRFAEKNSDYRTIALLHDLLEDCPEWNEDVLRCFFDRWIVDVVVVLTKGKNEKYSDYIDRVKDNICAVKVKLADLEDNMDITRLKSLEEKDIERLKKYLAAYKKLNS